MAAAKRHSSNAGGRRAAETLPCLCPGSIVTGGGNHLRREKFTDAIGIQNLLPLAIWDRSVNASERFTVAAG
uniref:Uncharacterized protein n=1 Tax=Arundo donax TaxID=35708 RepID=A0A0A8YIC6_ARUDO